MNIMIAPTECLKAGTWVWWVEADRFMGDRTIADLFDIDAALLEKGVEIEAVRTAVHPDDLEILLATVQTSIDDRLPYRSHFRVRRSDGLVRNVLSIGQCFFEEGRLVQFAGMTVELAPPQLFPTIDRLTEQLLAAHDTARALGEPYRLLLLEMILADIGKITAHGMEASMTNSSH